MSVCMYVCMYVCVCVYIYIYIYIYITSLKTPACKAIEEAICFCHVYSQCVIKAVGTFGRMGR